MWILTVLLFRLQEIRKIWYWGLKYQAQMISHNGTGESHCGYSFAKWVPWNAISMRYTAHKTPMVSNTTCCHVLVGPRSEHQRISALRSHAVKKLTFCSLSVGGFSKTTGDSTLSFPDTCQHTHTLWAVLLQGDNWTNFRTGLETKGRNGHSFAVDWMIVSPISLPKFLCGNLIPSVMVFRGGALRRWLGHEGGPLLDGISALLKETSAGSLSPSTIRGPRIKTAICELGHRFSPDPDSAGALTMDSPSLWNCKQ